MLLEVVEAERGLTPLPSHRTPESIRGRQYVNLSIIPFGHELRYAPVHKALHA